MTTLTCSKCGAPKPEDQFRACSDCWDIWRRCSRKPGGPAETIEVLRAKNRKLPGRVAALEGGL